MSVEPKKTLQLKKERQKQKEVKKNLKIAKSIIYNVSGSAPEAAIYLLKTYKDLELKPNKEILEISKKQTSENISKNNSLIHLEIENLSKSINKNNLISKKLNLKKLTYSLLIATTIGSLVFIFIKNKETMPPTLLQNKFSQSQASTLESSQINSSAWKADFYCNKDLKGKPCLSKTLNKINTDWRGAMPYEGIDGGNFSVRYQTCIKLKTKEKVYFSIGADDGYRFKINNRTVKKDWKIGAFKTEAFSIKLKSGLHKLTLEYFQGGGASRIEIKAGKDKENLLEITFPNDKEISNETIKEIEC